MGQHWYQGKTTDWSSACTRTTDLAGAVLIPWLGIWLEQCLYQAQYFWQWAALLSVAVLYQGSVSVMEPSLYQRQCYHNLYLSLSGGSTFAMLVRVEYFCHACQWESTYNVGQSFDSVFLWIDAFIRDCYHYQYQILFSLQS